MSQHEGKEQLQLQITPRLSYASQNFSLHAGVSGVFAALRALLQQPSYSISVVPGASRTGKTHFAIYLYDQLIHDGLHPVLVEGPRLSDWLASEEDLISASTERVVIIDDADQYLMSVEAGESGPFVGLIEAVRAANGKVVLLVTQDLSELPCDEHIMSRLLSALYHPLSNPDECDVEQLIEQMSRQRGVQLSPRKRGYLEKRVGRDVPSIEEYLDRLTYLANTLGESVDFELLGDALE